MNKLNEIGLTLGKAYIEQKEVEIRLSHQRQDLDARKLYLTPPDGWPGKNESERKTAAEKSYATDEPCQLLSKSIREDERTLSDLSGVIQAMEAERRALEWSIRERLVMALTHEQVYTDEPPVEETAFDAAALDAELDYLSNDANFPAPVVSLDDTIPF